MSDQTVAWIDGHRLTGDAIRVALQAAHPDLQISLYRDCQSCIDDPALSDSDLAIYHHRQADGDPMRTVTLLRERFAAGGILILTDPADLPRMKDMRASFPPSSYGIVSTQSASLRMLRTAMEFVSAGGVFLPDEMLAPKPQIMLQETRAKGFFTPREQQVRALLRVGQPNKVIAYNLQLSESTVKVHIRNLLRKTKSTNRTQLAFSAL
jgi:DNA-binding NarL/FixJ family response regulator